MKHIEITDLIDIARDAGDAILEIYNSGSIEVETKTDEAGHDSPLTQADTASHELITQRLNELYPNTPVVSEEQDESINLEAMKSERVFVIDPIDGTKGFVKRNGEFTINIGVLVDTIPTAGVVFAPVHELMYWADESGAFCNDNPIEASPTTTVQRAVASKSHMDETTQSFLKQFGDIEIVTAGSSLKICKVAEGKADVYPRLAPTTMEWDTAAADAIVRAAGGKVIDLHGNDLPYGKAHLRNLGFVVQAPNVTFTL